MGSHASWSTHRPASKGGSSAFIIARTVPFTEEGQVRVGGVNERSRTLHGPGSVTLLSGVCYLFAVPVVAFEPPAIRSRTVPSSETSVPYVAQSPAFCAVMARS
jgi:hypothetical protein